MCAACVAQGVAYVGGALTGLQVMGARAKAKRRRPEPHETTGGTPVETPVDAVEPEPGTPVHN
jgi:hypothetical protein